MFVKRSFESGVEKVYNFLLFPYRAFILNPNQSSTRLICLRDERMYYVKQYCKGKTLDLGCGPGNVFVRHFLDGDGTGLDVFKYPGLQDSEVVNDPCNLPFPLEQFDTVTLIANFNHIPTSIVSDELKEIARVTAPNGQVLVTRIGLITSLLTHTVVKIQSLLSKEYYDMDSERGVEHDERYTVSRQEINALAEQAGMKVERIIGFWTQWYLNELLILKKV